MFFTFRSFSVWLFWLVLMLLGGCAARPENQPRDIRLVTVPELEEKTAAPSFLVPEWQQPYNRIGTVRARRKDRGEDIFIEPDPATVYYGRFTFTSGSRTFVNHVYRVHFAKIPFSLIPFHLGAGSNVGLLVVITMDSGQKPILVTIVNTCGCYVAVIPTSYLPKEAYPDNWPEEQQRIYGEILPTRLQMAAPDDSIRITVRPEVHRVMDVQVIPAGQRPSLQPVIALMEPLSNLKALPLPGGGTTSMFYETWPLRGHVKGAIKGWESLLLSLVSLDFYVGMDKEYGDTDESGNPFYTSLKPWNRRSSDMNDFARFLRFHGWNLYSSAPVQPPVVPVPVD